MSNEDLQRVSVVLTMMLNQVGGVFGFEYKSFDKLASASPDSVMLHIGAFNNPRGNKVVVAWVGDLDNIDIQNWINEYPLTEENNPIAYYNPSVN